MGINDVLSNYIAANCKYTTNNHSPHWILNISRGQYHSFGSILLKSKAL